MKNPNDVTFDICRCYVLDNQRLVGQDISNKILGWIRNRDIRRLSSCVNQFEQAYSCSTKLRFLMQVEAFFKKNAAFSSDSTRAVALANFDKGEEICRRTNRRLEHYFLHRDRLDPDVQKFIDRAQRYISRVLGPSGAFLESLPDEFRVTPGATSTRSRRNSHRPLKITKRPFATCGAQPYVNALANYLGIDDVRPRPARGNRVEFVPKNWKTDRTIACEPEGNMPFQLAVDSFIKRRLKTRAGIDLSDQSKNQRLALEGSLLGNLATIDLSMASDTVSINVVRLLFPIDWGNHLFALRSPVGVIEGADGEQRVVTYAKYASMGNGSTFVVETLIFAACCYAVGSKRFSVYGDDIIIETEHVERLERLLAFLGFRLNSEKSHVSGPFRESCGAHYHLGDWMTPFYIRDVNSIRAVMCHNVNGLAFIASPGGALAALLMDIVHELQLPQVPYTGNSMDGVWVDVHSAYCLGLIRRQDKTGILRYKRYKRKTVFKSATDIRGLMIWLLDTRKRDRQDHRSSWDRFAQESIGTLEASPRKRTDLEDLGLSDFLISSRYPTPSHKYVRGWATWLTPVEATPGHLYWWSEFLIRRKGR